MNIKFCGNCNPDIDPKHVRKAVDRLFIDAEQDTLIMIHGCTRACLTKARGAIGNKKIISLYAREVVQEQDIHKG